MLVVYFTMKKQQILIFTKINKLKPKQMKKMILIICVTIALYSCKKEEKSSTPSTTTSTPPASSLIGKWAHTPSDTDPYTRDTIYVYQSGVDYYITAPSTVTSYNLDTLGITISGDVITIPAQIIYSTVSLSGTATKVLPNQLNISWTTSTPSNLSYTDLIYIRQ